MNAPIPADDAQRVETLRRYDVLDTPPEQSFDDLTLLAAQICQTPMAAMSLVDTSRQWFKSKIGVSAAETSRDIAFCAHTILQKDEIFEVRDAEADARFVDSPLVKEDPHIRFYAGAPLIAPDGHALGALCVMNRAPQQLSSEQATALRALGRQVVTQLELRRNARKLASESAERQRAQDLLREQLDKLSVTKNEADRLLSLAEKSRRALLSVVEDEKRAGQSLRDSEERFRQLAENINEVFWISDPVSQRIIYVSPAYEKIWGRSRASLYASAKACLDAVHPEDRERVDKANADLMVSGVYDAEYRIVRPDKSICWIHDRGFPVNNSAGEFYRIVGTAEDITSRKLAERRTAMQNTISRVLAEADSMKDAAPKIIQAICGAEGWDCGGLWEADKKSTALQFVEGWCRENLPADEVLDRNRELTFNANAGMLGRVWMSGQPKSIADLALDENYKRAHVAAKYGLRGALAFPILLEGKVIAVMDFLAAEIRGLDDKLAEMFLSIGRQIGSFCKRKTVEDQFRQAQKMESIGQLAGGVAHDFNNILAVIQMQSDLLKASGELSADQSEFATEIGVTVERATALTRQLLLFSRRETFQPRDLDLSESITNVTKMLRRIVGENVQVQLKLASRPAFIHADAGMMDQVLLNLTVNSRDAMPNGGQLIIETAVVEIDELAASQSPQARPGCFARLSVSDTGTGIPREVLPKIFEPFFTTKEVGKGTGLGLATVFGIVQQHQGWVSVYSEVGHGTTFRIYLPHLQKEAQAKAPAATPSSLPRGNETILLAEDDPSLRVSVRKTLSQLGYRILEAPTGVKALEVWKQNRAEINLLLTDLMMPDGMTGKALAERVHEENPRINVIYMSGYSSELSGKDFPLNEGVNFLTKPFPSATLAKVVRAMLDESAQCVITDGRKIKGVYKAN